MADEYKTRIRELEGEIALLKKEAATSREREQDLEKTRRAMLLMLEDLNESSVSITRSKNEWEATFDSIADPLFIHDSGMKIIRCNKAYQKAAGLPFREIVGKPYYDIFPKTGKALDICKQCVQAPSGSFDGEEEVLAAQGRQVFKTKVYSIKGLLGRDDYFLNIMEDITEAKRAAEREKIFSNFTRKIMANLALDYRLRVVCESAVEFGYKSAWIGFLNEETMDVTPMAQAGAGAEVFSSIKVKYDDSPLGRGPTGRAVRQKGCEVQNNIRTGPGYEPWRKTALDSGFGSSAAFPVMEEGKVIAVLNIYCGEDIFPGSDTEFLQTFANHTATYIKNARLFHELKESSERVKEEMECSNHLLMIASATAHTTDIDRLMDQVVNRLQSILGCDICLSYLWDGEGSVFRPCQGTGLGREMAVSFRVETLDMRVPFVKDAIDGRGVCIELPGQEAAPAGENEISVPGPAPFRWVEGLNAAVVIPLMGKEHYLGLLVCLFTGRNAKFSSGLGKRDRAVMDGISYQVSTALDEARLYKVSIDKTMDLSRKINTIQTMNEIDRAILSTLDPQEMLETATRMVAKLIACDRATIVLVDKERGGFIYSAGFGLSSFKKGGLVEFKDTSATEVLKTGRPQYLGNLSESGVLPVSEGKLLKEGFLSHIRVPLTIRGEVIGVLSIGAKRPSAFTSEDLSVVEKLSSQIGVALENARLVSDLGELFLSTVKTLAGTIDAKSPWTMGHSERVTKFAMEIGREAGLAGQDLKDLEIAGLLHDIGKLGTYEAILEKPGKLTEEELKIMRLHPQKGAEILTPIRQLKNILPAIRHHHEHYDGRGYPEGLKGEGIPLLARILTVADTVDAMGADRPYRKGMSMGEISAELKRCSGTQFDPLVVEAFLKTLPGTS